MAGLTGRTEVFFKSGERQQWAVPAGEKRQPGEYAAGDLTAAESPNCMMLHQA